MDPYTVEERLFVQLCVNKKIEEIRLMLTKFYKLQKIRDQCIDHMIKKAFICDISIKLPQNVLIAILESINKCNIKKDVMVSIAKLLSDKDVVDMLLLDYVNNRMTLSSDIEIVHDEAILDGISNQENNVKYLVNLIEIFHVKNESTEDYIKEVNIFSAYKNGLCKAIVSELLTRATHNLTKN